MTYLGFEKRHRAQRRDPHDSERFGQVLYLRE